jgi:serine/arginine repetitive matrix protein 2
VKNAGGVHPGWEMFGNVGLKTPRGSGTNGYVQKNQFVLRRKKKEFDYDALTSKPTDPPVRKPSDEVLLHKHRRQIELDLLEFREHIQREDPHISPEQVEDQVGRRRRQLLEELDRRLKKESDSAILKEQKEEEMEKMKQAFGIGDDFEEGQAFKRFSDKGRKERLARYEQEQRELFYEQRKRITQ